MQFRGRSPRIIGRREEPHPPSHMPQRSFRTRRKGRRPRRPAFAGLPGWVGCIRPARPTAPAFTTVRRHRVRRPTHPIPRAQPAHLFKRANRSYPSTKAGRAWKPAPTACWVGIRSSPTPPSTPQSRPFGPCQLPFQGSREGVYGRTHVIRHPTPGGRRLYRLRGLASLTRMGGLYAPWGAYFARGRGLCPRAWPWPRPRSAGCRWGGRRRK